MIKEKRKVNKKEKSKYANTISFKYLVSDVIAAKKY